MIKIKHMDRVFLKNKELIGSKYFLKPFVEANISEEYIRWLNDPKVNSYLEVRHEKQTNKSVKNYINSFYDVSEKYIWGIYVIDKKKHIGTVNISIDRYNSAEIGLMIGDKSYWGKLASDEAIKMVVDFAFKTLKINRITGGTYAENIGMIFTFKSLGFRREAVLKESVIGRNGKYSDIYRWAILAHEWRNK